MTTQATQRQLKAAYRAGWNRSSDVNYIHNLDDAETTYRVGRTESQTDAFIAGWVDYAADHEYGYSLETYLK